MTVFVEPRRIAGVLPVIRSWRTAEISAGGPVRVGGTSRDCSATGVRR